MKDMQHDLKHELKQNDAIRHLALAVTGLANALGRTDLKRLVDDVEAILSADEAEAEAPPVEAAPAEAEDAESKPE